MERPGIPGKTIEGPFRQCNTWYWKCALIFMISVNTQLEGYL
jgi:hypothetical protein